MAIIVTDLLTGSPVKRISAFCVPLLIGNLFQQFYSMTDSVIVGRLMGAEAFGAVGSTGALSFLVLGFVMGLCAGFSIPLSQDFGAKDMNGVRKGAAMCIWLCVLVTAVLSACMYFWTDELLRLLNTPDELFEDAYAYIHVIFTCMGASVLYNMLAYVLRAVGDSRTPLYFLILSCILNIGLDLLFIGPFHMGVAGAGYATIIAQLVSGALCLWTIHKRFPELRLTKDDLRFDPAYAARLFKSGVPMGLQFSITAVGSVSVQAAVNGLGSIAVTAMSAASRVSALMTCPLESLGIAMATFAGQNLGAKKLDRVRKGVRQMMGVGLCYCAAAFLTLFFFSRPLTLLFLDGADEQMLLYARQCLTINAAFYPGLLIVLVYRNTIQGLGYSKEAMLAGLFELVGRTGVAFGLVSVYGFIAACTASPVAWILADAVLLILYYKKMRQLARWDEAKLRAERMRAALEQKRAD